MDGWMAKRLERAERGKRKGRDGVKERKRL
jgi:hypothetical protein